MPYNKIFRQNGLKIKISKSPILAEFSRISGISMPRTGTPFIVTSQKCSLIEIDI
jgi:hypothetical protein